MGCERSRRPLFVGNPATHFKNDSRVSPAEIGVSQKRMGLGPFFIGKIDLRRGARVVDWACLETYLALSCIHVT